MFIKIYNFFSLEFPINVCTVSHAHIFGTSKAVCMTDQSYYYRCCWC